MSVLYKAGVCGDPHPMVQKAIGAVHSKILGYGDLIVTSIRDGSHSAGSLHPICRAVDIRHLCCSRMEGVEGYKLTKAIVADACDDVSPYLQVIDEGSHIHIEYDPPEEAL